MERITIGSATAAPGEIVTGWLDAVGLPTGAADRFPVILAQGREAGPVFWVTAGIHGGEHAGVVAAHQLVTPALVDDLRGTLVVIPALNPSGLRTRERSPYYYHNDPNRLFPDPEGEENGDDTSSGGLEAAYARLYRLIEETKPAALLDLHTAQISSLPMVFRDPVLYHRRRGRGRTRAEAEALQARVGTLLGAFGFMVINEFAAESYLSKNLHRSVSGAVLNGLGIPAATVELGSWMHLDVGVVEACVTGLRNALRWAGMLGGAMEAAEGIAYVHSDGPVRRHMAPRAPEAGLAVPLVRPGERISRGQPLAKLVDIFGQPVGAGDGLLLSEHDGFVLAWQHGVIRYEGEPVMMLAIPDDSEMVVAYPY